MKSLALALCLSLASCAHIQPVLDCAAVSILDSLPTVLADLDDWSKLDADLVRFGRNVFVCTLQHIVASRGNAVEDTRSLKAREYMKARGL